MKNDGKESDLSSRDQGAPADGPFQKGNINFDFLQPETQSLEAKRRETDREASPEGESKKGLFFRDRNPIPLSFRQVAGCFILFGASLSTMIWSVFYGRSRPSAPNWSRSPA